MKRHLIGWVVGAVVLIALVGIGISMKKEGPMLPFPPLGSFSDSSTPSPSRTPPAGYKEYRNEVYHFSLFYPDDLRVSEFKEPRSSLSVVFESAIDDHSFQIYVTPYGAKEITAERLKLDIPSGTIREQTNITLDGKPALMFFSSSVAGNLREVWFLNHGFLYEVTTYQELDGWLAAIMTSWKFI